MKLKNVLKLTKESEKFIVVDQFGRELYDTIDTKHMISLEDIGEYTLTDLWIDYGVLYFGIRHKQEVLDDLFRQRRNYSG